MWWVESLRQTQLSVLLTEPAPEMRSTSPHCSPQKSPHCYPLMRHLAGLPDNMSWTIVHRLHECRIIHMTSTHCELTCLLGARAGQPWARIEPAPLGVLAAHSSTEPPRPHSIVSKICSVWWSSALLCPGQASPGYQAGPGQATPGNWFGFHSRLHSPFSFDWGSEKRSPNFNTWLVKYGLFFDFWFFFFYIV